MAKLNQAQQHYCVLCQRLVKKVSAHHLTPKSRGGRVTIDICLDCHGMIHALFPNKQLERQLNTVEDLQAHPEFAKYLSWISDKPSHRQFRASRSKRTRRRGRSG